MPVPQRVFIQDEQSLCKLKRIIFLFKKSFISILTAKRNQLMYKD